MNLNIAKAYRGSPFRTRSNRQVHALLDILPLLLGPHTLDHLPHLHPDLLPISRRPFQNFPHTIRLFLLLLAHRLHTPAPQFCQSCLHVQSLFCHFLNFSFEIRERGLDSAVPQRGSEFFLFDFQSNGLFAETLSLAILFCESFEEVLGGFFLSYI